jgi:AraC family transcriptional regulator, transcriptional activator of the genes for pyochelin and ferripyochelin receptors
MNAIAASLTVESQAPRRDDAVAGALDMFGPGLVIANRCDPTTVHRLLEQGNDDVLILAILSQPRSTQLVLTIANAVQAHDRAAELTSRGIVLCAASRFWLEEECGDGLATRDELLHKCRSYFLDADTARLANDLVRSPLKGRVGALYQNAKCRELICSAILQLLSGNLVPVGSDTLSIEDTRRLMEARRLIATNFSEKLTLGSIAKACGLNRTKLAWGFRELFDCSIAEALAERRLNWASTELVSGRMSIAQIAYSSGYLSHASFSRAFGRHYGVPPKQWRRLENCDGSHPPAC